MVTSHALGKPIRVFRSSASETGAYKAVCNVKNRHAYRFDGLYRVDHIECMDENGRVFDVTDQCSSLIPNTTIYLFHLTRVEWGDGEFRNKIPSDKFEHCICNSRVLSPKHLRKIAAQAALEVQLGTRRSEEDADQESQHKVRRLNPSEVPAGRSITTSEKVSATEAPQLSYEVVAKVPRKCQSRIRGETSLLCNLDKPPLVRVSKYAMRRWARLR
jgi:hypothetical protein